MSIKVVLPETVCAGLVAELAELAKRGIPDEFTLARFENVARANKDNDTRHFLYVMGAVAALRGDVDAVQRHFDNCISLHGYDAVTAYNYTSSLLGAGYSVLAHVQAVRGTSAFPTDQDLASLRAEVLGKMTTEMWADMENDTEEDLTRMCMMNFAAGED